MKVSIVIPVQEEEKTLGAVLKEVQEINPYEIIVVLNGSKDRTEEIAKSFGCKIIKFVQALGNDVGRAIGAKHASGDIILFLDGDIIVPHKELIPFVDAIRMGNDIALNDLSFLANHKVRPHYTTVSKLAVNAYLRQSTLSLNSLLAVPHAIKRIAIEKIGWRNLADPILAQALAVKLGLHICAPSTVDVINTNRIRSVHRELDPNSSYPKTTSRIIGDHLRSISYLTNNYGLRGGFLKGNYSSNLPTFQIHKNSTINRKSKYSAIIAISGENQVVFSLMKHVKLAGVDEIILVVNMVKKETIAQALLEGAIVIEFKENCDPNFARFVGSMHVTADICLFLNGNQVILAEDLKPFLRAVENGSDIALNNRKVLLDSFSPSDFISTGQYFVNMAANRPDLLNNGLSFVPYALHKNVIETIGYDAFIVPPLAQIKAILAGFRVGVVQQKKHFNLNYNDQDASKKEKVLGDQLEAISYLLQQTDQRGGFLDGGRRREFLQ
jgi:glycosyltransferase involved in cell wall biosynthesis